MFDFSGHYQLRSGDINCVRFNFYDIPEFREAVRVETNARDAAFLNIPANICGLQIRQMTPRDFLILHGLENPIISGCNLTDSDISDFLHFMAVNQSPWHRFWKMFRMDYLKALEAIGRYFESTFQDTPGGTKSAKSVPIASWFAHRVFFLMSHNVCRTIDEALDTPFRIHNQIINCVIVELNPDYKVHARHGKVLAQRLELKNARLQLLQLLSKRSMEGRLN